MKVATRAEITAQPNHVHDIVLYDGHFDGHTSAADVAAAFQKLQREGHTHLSVFFHGGLVDYDSGLDAATQLLSVYDAGFTYPFFFIWRSGLLDALRDQIKKYEHDPVFIRAANKAFDFAAAKIEEAMPQARLARRRNARVRASGSMRSLKELAELAEPYDKAWQERQDIQLSCTASELKKFGSFLTRMGKGPAGKTRFRPSDLRGSLHLLSRIIRRLNTHHDHFLYTTIVEECLIALKVDRAAQDIWKKMKDFIDDSFKPDDDAGGTVFLKQLSGLWTAQPNLRVTLLAHSAGSIYVQRFIEELDARFGDHPERKVEVIYMAPAVSMARVLQGLEAFKRRVSQFRMFTLNRKAEHGYFEVPIIYEGSLLYIVSGLCETDPYADKPILGMQRYWSGEPPYHGGDIQAVKRALDPNRVAWCPTTGDVPGWECDATKHGCFALNQEMEDSAEEILEHGFRPRE